MCCDQSFFTLVFIDCPPPPLQNVICLLGFALIGNDACRTCQSRREVDNHGTVFFFFFGGHHDGCQVSVDHVVRGGEP